MSPDRYTKIVLIVATVCLLFLTLAVIDFLEGPALAQAAVARVPSSSAQAVTKYVDERQPVRASTATEPLRWKVAWATDRGGAAPCGTAVVVTNESSSQIKVEVEWFSFTGAAMDLGHWFVGASGQRVWVSGDPVGTPGVDPAPFVPDVYSNLSNYLGYARVHAADPRVHVAAFQFCRDGLGASQNIVAITQIPVSPVGATTEYFQAGMPMNWTPPMVEPEMPE